MVRDLLCSKRATKQDTDLKVANATELVAEGQVKSLPLLFLPSTLQPITNLIF